MPAIPEGNLVFDFPDADNWHAFKYDDTDLTKPGFYRERIGVLQVKGMEGIKGVDIVAGIKPDFYDLTLLEIKDFREDEPGLREKVSTGEIPIEIIHKALHTWGALCLGARADDALLPDNLRTAILRPPQRLRVVFFLAQLPIRQSPNERDTRIKKENRRKQRQGILKRMQEGLKPLGIKSDLAGLGELPDRCGWTVTELL
ncbi:MAG: hypothetical protein ACRYFZ_19165 [Janthinobacterium lividum]